MKYFKKLFVLLTLLFFVSGCVTVDKVYRYPVDNNVNVAASNSLNVYSTVHAKEIITLGTCHGRNAEIFIACDKNMAVPGSIIWDNLSMAALIACTFGVGIVFMAAFKYTKTKNINNKIEAAEFTALVKSKLKDGIDLFDQSAQYPTLEEFIKNKPVGFEFVAIDLYDLIDCPQDLDYREKQYSYEYMQYKVPVSVVYVRVCKKTNNGFTILSRYQEIIESSRITKIDKDSSFFEGIDILHNKGAEIIANFLHDSLPACH